MCELYEEQKSWWIKSGQVQAWARYKPALLSGLDGYQLDLHPHREPSW